MKHLLATCLIGTSLLFAQGASTTTPKPQPGADEMKKVMDATFSAMVPMMVKMTEGVLETTLAVAEKPETAKRLAKFKRNLYLALLEQGFTKEEALAIVLNTQPVSASPSTK